MLLGKLAIKLSTLVVVLGLDSSDVGELSRVVYSVPESFVKIQGYIDTVQRNKDKDLDPILVYPLSQPRRDHNISETSIIYYLEHSLLSFCSQGHIDAGLCFCSNKFENASVAQDLNLESRATVAVDSLNQLIVVSYRLSVAPNNWSTNEEKDLVSYPFPDGEEKVHHGHLNYFRSIQKQTEKKAFEYLSDPRHKDYTLHVTGYSLGGSVTFISVPAWLDFLDRNEFKNKARFFAYSNPRPGNLAFANYLEALDLPLVRYAKKGDIVPHLPEQSDGFSHVGQEFYDPEMTSLVPTHLKKCSPNYVQDINCSLKDTFFISPHHLLPFNKPFPLPPMC
ncbi:hypothetical protein DSO57_1019484 [Entomophthora muscae]|uniref:Uncharacterized protein n=1 Tax=Entomophthora muscae TaxID=34485 RepID=A0ACC2T436_9FUNG|nr:hypothetical protein DSO57_1019484 [Entomophthora muscae]